MKEIILKNKKLKILNEDKNLSKIKEVDDKTSSVLKILNIKA